MGSRTPHHTVAILPANPRSTAEAVDFRTHITVADAATVLNLSPNHIYYLVRQGRLKAVRTPLGMVIHVDSIGRERWRRELARREATAKLAQKAVKPEVSHAER